MNNGKAPVIVSMGEALMDFVAHETGVELGRASTFHKRPGGAAANVAVALTRLGIRSRFVTKVGDDPFGRCMLRVLGDEGVDLQYVKVSRRWPTGLVFVALDEDRTPSFSFFGDPSADMMMTEDEIEPEMMKEAAFMHAGTVSMVRPQSRAATFKLMELAREAGAKISFDPNLRLHLWKDHSLAKDLSIKTASMAQLVKLGRDELEFITGASRPEQGAASIRELGPDVVVVTMGKDGAYFACDRGEGEVPAIKVEAVDTTGSGDGFAAGLLAELVGLDHWPPGRDELEAAVRFGSAVGALVATEVGAMSALPDRSRVLEFLGND